MGFGNSAPKVKSITINGDDSLAVNREVNTVVRSDGKVALATDARVVVESTFGFDPLPDSFFNIINTGNEGDQWTIYIGPTTADPSAPDRDVPSYTKVFTVQASEVGDELKFRNRIVTELNLDSTFRNTCLLKAVSVTDRSIVHITSTVFSLSGEFYERPFAGDFNVTVTGSAVRILGFDNLISRSKPISISRDPDSPHNLGVFGISGSVSVVAKRLDDLFIQNATDTGLANGDPSLLVNGSLVSPITRSVNAKTEIAIFIEEIRFYGQGNGIQFKNFLAGNGALTNGILIEIKSDNTITELPVIKTTADFKNKFAFGAGANGFQLDIASGRDDFLAVFTFNNPFIIRESGAFGAGNDDYIRIIIRDNLIPYAAEFEFIAKGFQKEP